MGCYDFDGTPLGSTPLCIMPEGTLYEGAITDSTGRVVDVTAVEGDTVTLSTPYVHHTVSRDPQITDEAIRRTREMSGITFVDCTSRPTPDPHDAYTEVGTDFSPADQRALTAALERPDIALYCSDREHPGTSMLRAHDSHRTALYNASERLADGECGDLDDTHCEEALRSARVALGLNPVPEETPDHFWDLVGVTGAFIFVGIVGHIFGHRYNARADAREAAIEAGHAARSARRYAEEAGTPEARRLAEYAEEAARNAENARRAGRSREAIRQSDRARAAADEAERLARIARDRRRGPDDRDPPAGGPGGGTPVVADTEVDVVSSADPGIVPTSGGETARVAVPDMARGILALHGGRSPDPSAEGAALLTGARTPVLARGALPLPAMPEPVAVPEPVVAPRPVVVPRLAPAL